jgi:predicted membrane channel-forming protein YqfA (hemolysin III family)
MTRLLRILFQLSWGLGLLSILMAVVVKFGQLDARLNVTGHTLFLIAGTFFLCALATREVERSQSST